MYKKGFTILELIIVCVFASLILIFFFIQKNNVDAMNRDDQRKTAINAMFYSLEEAFYTKNGYYPETISEENLKSMDPQLFTDPSGVNIGSENCNYSYEPANCKDGKCKAYTLRATLEKEDTFIKRNRNN